MAMNVSKGSIKLTGSTLQDEMLKKHNEYIIRSSLPQGVFPPIVSPTFTAYAGTYPKWMDKDGNIWATNTGNIYKSTDYGATWTNITALAVNTVTNGDIYDGALLVSDTGRVIVCTMTGKVIVSDTTPANPAVAFTFTGGYTSRFFTHVMCGNIILLGAYGVYNAVAPPKEVYMSADSGATWVKVFDGTPIDAASYHIHDVEYDPYANRIWVAVGDNAQDSNIWYSDDFGANWTKVFNSPIPNYAKVTQIIAFPHGVLFGSDSATDGFRYWPRPKGIMQSAVSSSDIISDFLLLDASGAFNQFATRRWNVRHKDLQVCIIPWTKETSATTCYPRLIASTDGLAWYEIYRHPSAQKGFDNIIGPFPGDPNRTIVGSFEDTDGTKKIFSASLPSFVGE